jgi:hypothetical protein
VIAAGTAVTGILCAWTGVAYLNVAIPGEPGISGPRPVGGWFVALGLLGAAGLLALGLAQWLAGIRTRLLMLMTLAFMSAGYVAANAVGMYLARFAGRNIPTVLHAVGLWFGAVLFLGALLEALRLVWADRPAPEQAG